MPTVFSKIISGEITSYKIAESENYYAFLDISPLKQGHTLVIPKCETDYIFDLDENVLAGLMLFAKKVATAIEKTVVCKRIAILSVGLEVPHAHLHLIPIEKANDIDFSNPKLIFTTEEFEQLASKISSKFIQ